MCKRFMISILCAGSAFGQATTATSAKPLVLSMGDPAVFGPVGITTALAAPMGIVTGAPYSAQVTTQRVQTLADGNRIEQITSGSVARDSHGRVRREEALPGLLSGDGEAAHFVMIDDPVAQVHWTLDATTKTAIKMQLPGGKNAFGSIPPPPPLSATTKTFFYSAAAPPPITTGPIQILARNASAASDPNVLETDLGTQTMEGVAAQGKRTTRTIPAGQMGNEQPIVITAETWYSPVLKVLVTSTSNDPRMGLTTYKLTNIQRSEPAANLFQVPEDYTVNEQPGPSFLYQDVKKNP